MKERRPQRLGKTCLTGWGILPVGGGARLVQLQPILLKRLDNGGLKVYYMFGFLRFTMCYEPVHAVEG